MTYNEETDEFENEKIIINSQKQHVIIKNGNEHIIVISTMKRSDITFENCKDIQLEFVDKKLGTVTFSNCTWERDENLLTQTNNSYNPFIEYEEEHPGNIPAEGCKIHLVIYRFEIEE